MKKLLLTTLVAFCFGGLAIAQEPAKVAKKKAAKIKLQGALEADAAKVSIMQEKKKAMEAEKAKPATSARPAKESLAAEKAN